MPTLTPTSAADLFRSEPDRLLDVGAGHVAYRRVGSGPDVLFVHGWPVSGATFRCLLPHLVDHVTCHVIDLPSAGSSRFDADTPLSIERHVETTRRVVDLLGFDSVALVGHDSGGLISRYAMGDDPRLRALGLINSETPEPGWRFSSFVGARNIPGFGAAFGWVAGQPKLRRFPLLLGDLFADRSMLDGEFDEFFLRPLHEDSERRAAAFKLLRSFDMDMVKALPALHARIDVPVKLVWGDKDPFFPVEQAHAMVATFPNATIDVIPGAGLFCHEERSADVAAALLPALVG